MYELEWGTQLDAHNLLAPHVLNVSVWQTTTLYADCGAIQIHNIHAYKHTFFQQHINAPYYSLLFIYLFIFWDCGQWEEKSVCCLSSLRLHAIYSIYVPTTTKITIL